MGEDATWLVSRVGRGTLVRVERPDAGSRLRPIVAVVVFALAALFVSSPGLVLVAFGALAAGLGCLPLRRATRESALLLPGVGLQYERTFVRWPDIEDVVIKEVISFQRVVYSLTVIVRSGSGQKQHLPLFSKTSPRLACLEDLYRKMQSVLSTTNSNLNKFDYSGASLETSK